MMSALSELVLGRQSKLIPPNVRAGLFPVNKANHLSCSNSLLLSEMNHSSEVSLSFQLLEGSVDNLIKFRYLLWVGQVAELSPQSSQG